jgi:hypothetical protein
MRLPISQDMRFHTRQLGDFANLVVKLFHDCGIFRNILIEKPISNP